MSRLFSVSEVLRLLVLQAIWLAGCVGGATVDQAEVPAEPTREETRVVDQHTRTFKVSVDGTDRGTLTMQLTSHDDGTETMRGQAELSFNFIVYKYRYTSSGTEVWKSGRLVQLANEADYNGDKFVVQASAQQQTLAVEVNGESQKTDSNVWVTSYWHEPEPNKIGQTLSLFEASKGRQFTGTLQRVGVEPITVCEESLNATHYQVRGDVEVDLWYDEDHRLIRQAAQESGHRVVLELSQITR